ncbi:hypothetical protein ABT298_23310 [Streptomyces sp. NPDC001034]|uniref:hypothetical protein n=1 Tax=Streptomyces sp. NPDC001034 TaxID=3154375 RepID=UPI00332CFD20
MTTSSPGPRAYDAASERLRALLERAATGADSRAWSELWTELYHNGTLDVAHPLVLRTLAGMARSDEADVAASALHLTFPLHPADPHALEGLGRRLYELALADGQEDVALALTYAFGEATCPECEQRFSVVGQVIARAG